MSTFLDDADERIINTLQEAMTGTLPSSQRAAERGVSRFTIIRWKADLVGKTQRTLELTQKMAATLAAWYLPLRRLLAACESSGEREHVLAVLRGEAYPNPNTPTEVVELRLSFQVSVALAGEVLESAQEVYDQAERLAPEVDEAAADYAKLREVLEAIRDFALLTRPRLHEVAALLGMAPPSEGTKKAG